tara:strand:+ start:367 stop:903 length:537 start_codon:yes stop_codon:yes gene_type:complete
MIVIVPHPDDEVLFLYSYMGKNDKVGVGDKLISVTMTKDRAEQWQKFGGDEMGLKEKHKYVEGYGDEFYAGEDWIPDFDDKVDKYLLNMPKPMDRKVVIPATNHLYGHKHHIQLEKYMYGHHRFDRKEKRVLSTYHCKRKIEIFVERYPSQKHIVEQPDIIDYLDLGVEVGLIFDLSA